MHKRFHGQGLIVLGVPSNDFGAQEVTEQKRAFIGDASSLPHVAYRKPLWLSSLLVLFILSRAMPRGR